MRLIFPSSQDFIENLETNSSKTGKSESVKDKYFSLHTKLRILIHQTSTIANSAAHTTHLFYNCLENVWNGYTKILIEFERWTFKNN